MNTSTPATLKGLITSSVLYIGVALIGAAVAIAANRPAAAPGVSSTGLPIVRDFLYGNGTAMSPPLYWLIAQALLTVLARRRDRWGTIGVAGLTIVGLLFGIFGFLEPIVLEIFNPKTFDLPTAIIEAGIIVLPFVMAAFGTLELVRRRREKASAVQPAGRPGEESAAV